MTHFDVGGVGMCGRNGRLSLRPQDVDCYNCLGRMLELGVDLTNVYHEATAYHL